MKNGYVCKCGWRLERVGTRRGYAYEKEQHAVKCEHLKQELKRSGKN